MACWLAPMGQPAGGSGTGTGGRGAWPADGNGLVANFAYNEAGGALTNVSYPTQPSYNVTYGHDSLGRVTSMSDAQGTITTTYDDLGNPLTPALRQGGA